ncbi:hypothetical protein [Actinokineospora globicatena]|uniref:hypothetical protein n=1 Tax=Actinokineospora globicatena TaxID=103729 RepID=UPI0020A2A077|nr:hypothetical protein [Actinokineospora globicatena]MCP2303305.1 hypothetical protein [Actinokineospora globicatena]GLW79565.1 hypothetical protein Aglo01_40470 [Actinokineospora globicatena]GLW86025.1 hypothetical protein Aglo02_36640 [Actinokineospora globicatena]
MIIVWTTGRHPEAALHGTPQDFHHLAALLRSGTGTLPLDPTYEAPHHDITGATATIHTADTPLARVTVHDRTVTFTGPQHHLDTLAEIVEASAEPVDTDSGIPYHHHVEHSTNADLLTEDTIPLSLFGATPDGRPHPA